MISKLRFELSGNDVAALVGILDYLLTETIAALQVDNVLGKNLLRNIKPFIRKLRAYALKAFDSREDYRNTIGQLKDEMEYQMKRFGMVENGQ